MDATATPDHLHVYGLIETVHLIEELHENTLHLTVSTCLCIKACCGDGIDLICKTRRRRVGIRSKLINTMVGCKLNFVLG